MTTATARPTPCLTRLQQVTAIALLASWTIGSVIAGRYLEIDDSIAARYGYVALFIVCAAGSLTLFLPVPGLALVFAAGPHLNPALAALAASTGMTVGMLPSYVAGTKGIVGFRDRLAGASPVIRRALVRTEKWMGKIGATTSFAVAAIPNPIFDVAGLLAGSLRMPLWRFALGTFGGKAVQAFVVAVAGAAAASI
ncbi:MAG: VTT domain-containing protein [Chloroflexi bacterium]|nr:VTT domain-containing protein [Chloroflexota bacterium]